MHDMNFQYYKKMEMKFKFYKCLCVKETKSQMKTTTFFRGVCLIDQ